VDVVALASVITSGVLGLGSLWTAVWTTRKNVQIAREQRVQQRLGEGYLELLRLVEREGQWLQRKVAGFERFAYDRYEWEAYEPKLRPLPEPEGTDGATIKAIVVAFGSPVVRSLHESWSRAVEAVNDERHGLIFEANESGDPDHRITVDDQKKLREELAPAEAAARQALADAIAAELNEKALPRQRGLLRRTG
jgi:hypothetical protein